MCFFCFLSVLRSMVTATAFQIFVSNNAAIKAVTDNTVVTLEVGAVGGSFSVTICYRCG